MLTWALKYRLYNHEHKFLECWIHLQYGLVYRPLCGEINKSITLRMDRLCGLVVRVSGYRYRGLGFDSRRYQIF